MTVIKTTTLGGTASNVTVGRVAHGLMMMTWRDPNFPLPDEEAFEAIKAGVDAMPTGVKMMLKSGEFYGPNFSAANLELLSRLYARYPEYADKTFLSVKGGAQVQGSGPDGSPENLRRSVDNTNAKLGGIKKMDLFEMARVPDNVPLEDVIKTLAQLKSEGKFDHIGISECCAESLRRAHAVHPITAVEIEVSLWSYEEETKKVIATAKELGVTVVAYSPLGRGFLTGTSMKEIPCKAKTDSELVHEFTQQYQYRSRNKNRNLENIAAGEIELTEAELVEISEVLAKVKVLVKGGRYNDEIDPKMLHLWGSEFASSNRRLQPM